MLQRWESIFFEEGAKGLTKERIGKNNTGGKRGLPPKRDKIIEEDLIAENHTLRMEIEYLKTECFSSCGRAKERQKRITAV